MNNKDCIIFTKRGLESFCKEQRSNDIDFDRVINVENLQHGTDENSKYIKQWTKYKGRHLIGCANLNCPNHDSYDALVGAHVKLLDDSEDSYYIVPLCHVCNSEENADIMTVYVKDLALLSEIEKILV